MSQTTISELIIKLGSDISESIAGLDQVGSRVQRLGRDISRTGRNLSRNFTVPVVAAGGAAFAAAVRVGNLADELLDMEQQTGLSTRALQEYRRVTAVAGVEQDALAKAAEQMTLRMSRGAEGSADMRHALDQLGIAARDTEGNLRPMDEVVNEALVGLADMEDITQRNVLATKLFSRSASELAPILGLGSDEIARLRQEAHDLGLVLDRDALEAANDFRIQWDTLRQSLKAGASEMGLAVLPLMSELVGAMQDHLVPMVQRVVEWFGNLDQGTLKVAAGVAAVAASIGPLLLVGGKLAGVFGLILSPAGLVVAALTSLAFVAITVARNWDVLMLQGTSAWAAIKGAVFDAVDGILGMIERLTRRIPWLGAKVQQVREDFNAFADRSLAKSGTKMYELERQIAENFTPAVEKAGKAARDVGESDLPVLANGAQAAREEIDRVAEALARKANRMQVVRTMSALLGDDYDALRAEASALTAAMETLASEGVDHTDERMQGFAARLKEIRVLMAEVAEETEDAADPARTLTDAFRDAAESSTRHISSIGDAVRRFVEEAIQEIAKLEAMKSMFAFMGPFAGVGAGLAASLLSAAIPRRTGGAVQPGRAFRVHKDETIIPTSPGHVMTAEQSAGMGGGGSDAGSIAAAILAQLGPPPEAMSPEAAAVHPYYRRLIGAIAADARHRGVEF